VGGIAARIAGQYILGVDPDRDKNAAELARALGGLKGPIMKVAQLLSTIPDALPEEYAAELASLQSQAPPMGWSFVKRRMAAELGSDWRERFKSFEHKAAASASLGQVHKATAHDGELLACKLQYPEMESAVEADLTQLKLVFSIHKRMNPAIETSEMSAEIGARLREELDYELEAAHMSLYQLIFKDDQTICVPEVKPELSTKRLLTMSWLDGSPLLEHKESDLEARNRIAKYMFRAWWYPFSQYGVIHGDPHLGNYNVFSDETGMPAGINLLDYGCMRTFAPNFVQGVIDLYRGLLTNDRALVVHAYETWGFKGLSNELIDILNIWANFIYGPMLEDRERELAEGLSPAQYGRRQAFEVARALREKGPVKVPREFVFMDRAAIGLGGVFLHLNAKLNYYRLFNDTIESFSLTDVQNRQRTAFDKSGVPLPEARPA
jgi:predicted unusual protein kinase regulating ubiquinone biosynthesis (AarF/ABC1/UbiB family)